MKSIQNFFRTKKGTATGFALAFSAFIFALALSTVAVVMNTLQENKNVEDSSVAYFSAERGLEYALLSISGHLSGYEVGDNSEEGEVVSLINNSFTDLVVESRSEVEDGKIVVPMAGKGSSEPSEDFNILQKGKTVTIPLYIDNTSKEQPMSEF
jgi:hypothetical protein